MAYLREKSTENEAYLVTNKKAIRDALGISERSLDKLLKQLKANQEIVLKVKAGRRGGIQIATVRSLLVPFFSAPKRNEHAICSS